MNSSGRGLGKLIGRLFAPFPLIFKHKQMSKGKIKGVDFSKALLMMKVGHAVTRIGWNGKGMSIEIQRPDENSKMGLPYIYMRTTSGELVPWVASNTDILSNDWYVFSDLAAELAEGDGKMSLKDMDDMMKTVFKECTEKEGVDKKVIKKEGIIKIEILDNNLTKEEREAIEKEIMQKLTN